ncbi:MAG: fatty acid desaturase family protein [Gammaproteobacteria bacterium]|tara:strand:- start:760 stop:1650 length:891 start_codon:yes stop_codon:yes gene_type:complete
MSYANNEDYQSLLNTVKSNISGVAWPTIITFFVAAAVIITLQVLYAKEQIHLLPHLIITSYFMYVMYTPLHEASHQNISGANQKYRFLNPLFGFLSALFYLHSYTQHTWSHLEHHKHANDKDLDPDYIIKGSNWFSIMARGFFILLIKDYFYIKNEKLKNDKIAKIKMKIGTIESLIPVILLIIFTNVFSVPWYHFILSYVIPLLFAVMLLGIFFDYLVHMPHQSSEKFGDTNVIRTKKWLDYPMTWIWSYQNYHGMHHLFPRLPFYKYKKVFMDKEDELIRLGLPIFTIEEKING